MGIRGPGPAGALNPSVRCHQTADELVNPVVAAPAGQPPAAVHRPQPPLRGQPVLGRGEHDQHVASEQPRVRGRRCGRAAPDDRERVPAVNDPRRASKPAASTSDARTSENSPRLSTVSPMLAAGTGSRWCMRAATMPAEPRARPSSARSGDNGPGHPDTASRLDASDRNGRRRSRRTRRAAGGQERAPVRALRCAPRMRPTMNAPIASETPSSSATPRSGSPARRRRRPRSLRPACRRASRRAWVPKRATQRKRDQEAEGDPIPATASTAVVGSAEHRLEQREVEGEEDVLDHDDPEDHPGLGIAEPPECRPAASSRSPTRRCRRSRRLRTPRATPSRARARTARPPPMFSNR